jgi:hypothetical protein
MRKDARFPLLPRERACSVEKTFRHYAREGSRSRARSANPPAPPYLTRAGVSGRSRSRLPVAPAKASAIAAAAGLCAASPAPSDLSSGRSISSTSTNGDFGMVTSYAVATTLARSRWICRIDHASLVVRHYMISPAPNRARTRRPGKNSFRRSPCAHFPLALSWCLAMNSRTTRLKKSGCSQ